jgi:PAS domain S-box-containing protein
MSDLAEQAGAVRRWVLPAIVLAAVAAVAAIVVLFAFQTNGQREAAAFWERHTFQVQLTTQALRTALDEAEDGQRGYLLVGDEKSLEQYRSASDAARSDLNSLWKLTADNSAQQANMDELASLIDTRLSASQKTIDVYRSGGPAAAVDLLRQDQGRQAMEAAQVVLARIEAEETRLLSERTAIVQRSNTLTNLAIAALSALGALLLLLAIVAVAAAMRASDRARMSERLKKSAEDLAKARDFLQLVIDNSIDPIYVKDRETRFVLANARAAELHGATKEDIIGKRASDFLPPDIAQVLEAADRDVASLGQVHVVEEKFSERGEIRTYQISKTPWRDDQGAVVGVIAVAHDITERTALEDFLRHQSDVLDQRVQQRTKEIEAASAQLRQLQKMEAVGQLTGGVAHDFNNMLAIVIGSLDMAARKLASDPDKARQYIENANEGARRAATLTARLLAFSRQQPLEPQPLDPNKLVGGMSELIRRTIGDQLQVEIVLAGGIWRTYADPNQLESALINLCVNARDAMPDGGHLTIETCNSHLDDDYSGAHAEVTAGQYVQIAVTDTGAGMAPEVVERAFDPFYTTKGAGRGTGLGLSQVYGFVKQSGGHVKIYSEPGRGTTVKVYLPRFVGAAAVKPTEVSAEGRPGGSSDEVILVVEDEPAVRQMSVEALRDLGYSVVHAESAAKALHQLDLHPNVNLMFTDIVMPEINGRQLAEEAVNRRPGLKVLYTTGYTRNAVVHDGTLDHGVALLSKPFSLDDLARKVRQVLDGPVATRPG